MVLKILAFGPGFRPPSDSTADPELSVLTHTSSSRPTPYPLPFSSTSSQLHSPGQEEGKSTGKLAGLCQWSVVEG